MNHGLGTKTKGTPNPDVGADRLRKGSRAGDP